MEHVTQSMRREYWKSIITECCSSGMKKKDWIELNHISHKSFYYWQKKLRIEAGTDLILANNNEQGIPAPFVQVALPDESHEDKNAIITVNPIIWTKLFNDLILRFGSDIDKELNLLI